MYDDNIKRAYFDIANFIADNFLNRYFLRKNAARQLGTVVIKEFKKRIFFGWVNPEKERLLL